MLHQSIISPHRMAEKTGEAAALLKALSNEHRLLILCHLIAAGELSVGDLLQRIDLGQSALSQHLARLREEGLVGFRREAQTLFYRVTDERAGQVLMLLRDIFCPDLASSPDNLAVASAPSRQEARRKGH